MEDGMAYLKYKNHSEAELRAALLQRDQELEKKNKKIQALEGDLAALKSDADLQQKTFTSLKKAFLAKEEDLSAKNQLLEAQILTLKEDFERLVASAQEKRQAREKETLSLSEASETNERATSGLLKNFSERVKNLRENSRSPPRVSK
jgi:chromosome segregation ATPase